MVEGITTLNDRKVGLMDGKNSRKERKNVVGGKRRAKQISRLVVPGPWHVLVLAQHSWHGRRPPERHQ